MSAYHKGEERLEKFKHMLRDIRSQKRKRSFRDVMSSSMDPNEESHRNTKRMKICPNEMAADKSDNKHLSCFFTFFATYTVIQRQDKSLHYFGRARTHTNKFETQFCLKKIEGHLHLSGTKSDETKNQGTDDKGVAQKKNESKGINNADKKDEHIEKYLITPAAKGSTSKPSNKAQNVPEMLIPLQLHALTKKFFCLESSLATCQARNHFFVPFQELKECIERVCKSTFTTCDLRQILYLVPDFYDVAWKSIWVESFVTRIKTNKINKYVYVYMCVKMLLTCLLSLVGDCGRYKLETNKINCCR
ncbi:hypothetical protein RFI_15543 [Reticulomyxa filosa]|uniref:CDT1 Geminin-binding domain-containing protein n=1 Tax=Reticulomyxa filosa TaxID=46433 RepID=X6N5T9_RETFI|nr:hypothetical protein RFI_15543 [Reticulomyxa filosa]|eukprot:ETO21655.1 hypothetical protein RFI_15543 [Reticulomyxa filosa]